MSSSVQAPSRPGGVTKRRSLYKGDPGMWTWVLHRISGVAIFFFLFVHVIDTAMVTLGPEVYNAIIGTYQAPIVGLMEIGLVALVLYHALNGIRVILIDFWSKGAKYQRQMIWIVAVVWVVLFAAGAYRLLFLLFEHL